MSQQTGRRYSNVDEFEKSPTMALRNKTKERLSPILDKNRSRKDQIAKLTGDTSEDMVSKYIYNHLLEKALQYKKVPYEQQKIQYSQINENCEILASLYPNWFHQYGSDLIADVAKLGLNIIRQCENHIVVIYGPPTKY